MRIYVFANICVYVSIRSALIRLDFIALAKAHRGMAGFKAGRDPGLEMPDPRSEEVHLRWMAENRHPWPKFPQCEH